ncbi:unnamed protein product [Bursaphelenchus xylophilus]|uniref:(pine wood nematode) hypothetical protein n=1 Tax=Bursaphelenchus xylophilus TaxID=6326 RepID=A0A7I8X6H2_BURXY|nr:unnamed protein product [Bursaphelenchus xylophilus]CAG9123368.1 unnamed protein product [Bursaphelenchus xylophilus]
MEQELRCPLCRSFLTDPILLQCSHSYCRECAVKALLKSSSVMSPPCSSSSASDTASICISDPDQECDKLSMVSETDSGVCIYNNGANGNSGKGSRPSSFLGSLPSSSTPSSRLQSLITPLTTGHTIICEKCQKTSFFADENAVYNQSSNLALRRLVERFKKAQIQKDSESSSNSPALFCQWCEDGKQNQASLYCESCGYFYCSDCQPIIHPSRGPLKDHKFVPAESISRKKLLSQHEPVEEHRCEAHVEEALTMFCSSCNIPLCCQCIQSARHLTHQVQSLATTVKTKKSELSRILQELSEKVKKASEDINEIKKLHQTVEDNCNEFQTGLNVQIDVLIQNLEERRAKLMEYVTMEKERKHRTLKEQVAKCAGQLNNTTALIQFCIEVLKEPDPIAYLHIDHALCHRATETDFLWNKNMITKPDINPEFVFNIDLRQVQATIQAMEFVQLQAIMRRPFSGDNERAPPRPFFLANECSAENNSVVLTWDCPRNGQSVDGFILELDSGKDDGRFKEVYRGPDSACTIDGLHFNTLYNARLKGFNAAGESSYSEPICLQTAPVAWFQLCKSVSQMDVQLSNQSCTVTGSSLDYSVVLGTVAFSRGVHFWEISVDRLDINTDIVVGVAQPSVDRHKILGKDIHGWAMYLDVRRSWFFHNGDHHGRTEQGVSEGEVIGVRLDCDQGRLSFYINGRPLGYDGHLYAFHRLPRGLYYPAFSVNKGAVITVHTARTAPIIDREDTPSIREIL